MIFIEGGITTPRGYVAAGCHCGIKKNSKTKDLALVFSKRKATAAGTFTTNRLPAASVVYSKQVAEKGFARAIIANSGCANSCTGAEGLRNAEEMAKATAEKLDISPDEVVVASTGVIGEQLPIVRIREGIGTLAANLSSEGGTDAAQAILTTDTRPKQVAVRMQSSSGPVTIGGIAKGAGMIAPNMATMLAFMTTDASLGKKPLRLALTEAVSQSFNRISVDGDTSTNDMVVILANGGPGSDVITERSSDFKPFTRALTEVCLRLAHMIVADGEGATKFVEITVRGALNDEQANLVARTIGTSNLVKTALFGEDPNWGRIMAAIGRSGADIEPDRITIFLDNLKLVSKGISAGFPREQARESLAGKQIKITVDIGMGKGEARFWTTDLTNEYVEINADYHT
jgi:glutamate N-acetyltransferase/amino-acid N-acetyltransferase